MPELHVDRLVEDATKLCKDALYVGVGFGVLTVQRAQVARRELLSALRTQVGEGKGQVDKFSTTLEQQLKAIDERLGALEHRVEGLLDQMQAALPEQAADVMRQAREAAKSAREQVRELIFKSSGEDASASAA